MKPPDFGGNQLAKWQWLEAAPLQDKRSPILGRIAASLRVAALGDIERYAHLALALARDGIRYQIDTERVGREDLGHPLEALFRGVDDCDAKSRLFVALCLLAGIPAKMMPLWENGNLKHVYAAVMINGKWYPAETTLSRARLGDMPRSVPKEKDGKWLRT
jgi:transglutaminase-like putative cysteine protease